MKNSWFVSHVNHILAGVIHFLLKDFQRRDDISVTYICELDFGVDINY